MPTPILEIYGGRYYALWSENRRSKRKSMGTSDRAAAEERFARWLLLGGHRDAVAVDAKPSLTVAELWAVYDKKHVETETASPASIRYCWKNLEVHFGKMAVSDIDQTTVEDYEEKRLEGDIGREAVSGTIRKELVALRAMLNWHASTKRGKTRLLEKSDVPDFDLPDESAPRDRWLTTGEVQQLLGVFGDCERMSRVERFLWLALETAARKQAILDLTWDRVDFETGMIHYAVPGRRATKKRRPSVPISARLRPVLERMKREATGNVVLDHGADIWNAVQAVVVRAGLAPKRDGKTGTGISPHTFRHTAATHMARRGVPLYTIAGVLGNSLQMVEKVYAKHQPGALRDAVNMISGEGALGI